MKTQLIVPVINSKQNVKIWNENEYTNIISELKNNLNKVKPKDAVKEWTQNVFNYLLKMLKENYNSSNGFLINVGENLCICFVKVDKIPQFLTIESIAKAILKNEN